MTKFIKLVQRYVAESSLGPSTLRNQGAPGVLQAARNVLAEANLRSLVCTSPRSFARRLDALTENTRAALPAKGRRWGTSRKAVNIFLRDALYNTYLADHFSLVRIEPWLELPLDSYTVAGLRDEYDEGSLPQWPGVSKVTPETYAEFQLAASEVAAVRGIARVHLDMLWWRRPAHP
jgi:hypothetical protein